MNFKRVAALLLAGAMVMTAVPVYAKGDDVTLSVSIWDTNQEPGIKEILADFTEKTGIKTEISVVKWDEYWTMLEAGAQGGSLPDVFWMHSNESQRYMSNDMLLDLTDKIKDSDLIDPDWNLVMLFCRMQIRRTIRRISGDCIHTMINIMQYRRI